MLNNRTGWLVLKFLNKLRNCQLLKNNPPPWSWYLTVQNLPGPFVTRLQDSCSSQCCRLAGHITVGPVRHQLQDMCSQTEAKSYNLRDFNVSLYKCADCRHSCKTEYRIAHCGPVYITLHCLTRPSNPVSIPHTVQTAHRHTEPQDQDLQRTA